MGKVRETKGEAREPEGALLSRRRFLPVEDLD
jgi:hypothetical protein